MVAHDATLASFAPAALDTAPSGGSGPPWTRTRPGRRPGARSALGRRTRARRGTGPPAEGRSRSAGACRGSGPGGSRGSSHVHAAAGHAARRWSWLSRRRRSPRRSASTSRARRNPSRRRRSRSSTSRPCASTCTAGSEPSRGHSMTSRCCCWPASRCSLQRSLPRRERRSRVIATRSPRRRR